MTPSLFFSTIAISTFTFVGVAGAQEAKHAEMDHTKHHDAAAQESSAQSDPARLTEPGQGAFAALSEVVRVLEADPETDWAKVNLTALRDHLIDMDVLVRDAHVRQTDLPNGISATVTGDTESLATAKRMVPAHAHELGRDDRWGVVTDVQDNAVILTVTSDDPATALRIKALGFYGLMASQDHHRKHHYIIAIGGEAHSGH